MRFITRASLLGAACLAAASVLVAQGQGQKTAILTPERTDQSTDFRDHLGRELSKRLHILDNSMVESAYLSSAPEDPFNMTTEQSKRLGAVIGCDFFIVTRSMLQPRSASGRQRYFEAYASIFVVSARTGLLVLWQHPSFEAGTAKASAQMLEKAADSAASKIFDAIQQTTKRETTIQEEPLIPLVPEEGSPAALNFRPPVPYRRIKPEYTAQAAFYDIRATVDIIVDLDAVGKILRTQIVRWAGYGLDESVEKTVRTMNWRPAERNGKPLPMRFLLRYNFKRIDKE